MKTIEEHIQRALSNRDLSLDAELIARLCETERRIFGDIEHTPIASRQEIIAERFIVLGVLGRGGQGTTYLAYDSETDDWVVVKELRFNAVEGWKGVELFEREAETLEQLDHPQIPKYIDATSFEDHETVRFVLAQSFVRGEDLGAQLHRGTRWTEEQAQQFLEQIAPVLEYLHGRSTPIVHRDIKPSNLIVDTDGTAHLVDFGAVQNALPKTVGGSTIIGTSGYVPLEQYMGRATPASDIYALGATIVHMMSGIAPVDMDIKRGRLSFEHYINVSEAFEQMLAKMLEPIDEDRTQSIAELFQDPEAEEEQVYESLAEIMRAKRTSAELKKIAPANKMVPIPSSSSNAVTFRDPKHRWVEIESRDEGKRLDRYVRAFPFETRLIVEPNEVMLERRLTPLAWWVLLFTYFTGWAYLGSIVPAIGWAAAPFLLAISARLYRFSRIRVKGADLNLGLEARIFITPLRYLPLTLSKDIEPTKSGLEIEVSDIKKKVSMRLDAHHHEYFASRFNSAITSLRAGERIEPLDIW